MPKGSALKKGRRNAPHVREPPPRRLLANLLDRAAATGRMAAPPLQVAVRRLAERGTEAAGEVRLGEVAGRGHGTDVERLGVGAVHQVAGAQQPPVQLLDFPAHVETLRHHPAGALTSRRVSGR
jgi:hypothetical protein